MLLRSNSRQSSYDEIPNVGESANGINGNRNFWDAGYFFRSWSLMKVVMLGMVLLLSGIIIVQGVHEHDIEIEQEELEYERDELNGFVPFVSKYSNEIPMPAGVNIGGWLSLEDYFFAGMHNSVEVATPGQLEKANKIAACLPPLHVGSTTGPKWHSETDLFQNLMDPKRTPNGSVQHAISVFAAHRASFVDFQKDLPKLAALGITTVRIPMSWCWSDTDPRQVDLSSYEDDLALLNEFACVDPFYPEILWPAVPKPLVEDLLRACAATGIRASLDVHTYPGGTSIGTFSGVWPNWPRFWTHGGDGVGIDGQDDLDTDADGFDIGHKLFKELVEWMEDLAERDEVAFSGLRGLSPMNEPAHLAGIFDEDAEDNFLPPLPQKMTGDFLKFLNKHTDHDYQYPDGTHLRVFYWFQGALEIFRNSKLPDMGKECQINIHESVFHWLAEWWESWRVDAELRGKAIATWWCASGYTQEFEPTTLAQERSNWAVLDMHHYHAWSDVCSGTIDGQDAAYACGDSQKRSAVLDQCVEWVQEFRDIFDGVCGTKPMPAKLMSAEFSSASHHSVRESCSDNSGLQESFVKQVQASERANVDLFYWSYKMPYGGSFKTAGWSFTELMYKLGVLGRPDAPEFTCDSHMFDDPEVP